MNSVHYLLFIPFHIGSAEIEKAAKVRKFKDFHKSVRRSPIIVSTFLGSEMPPRSICFLPVRILPGFSNNLMNWRIINSRNSFQFKRFLNIFSNFTIHPEKGIKKLLILLLSILQPHFLYAHLQKDFPSNLHQFYRRITYRLPFEPETHLVRSQHHKYLRFLAI